VGTREDWDTFYDAEYYLVVRFVMRNGASLEDACDAAGDAFADSWELVKGKPEAWAQIENQRSWIRVVALRKYRRPPGPRRRPLLAAIAEIPEVADGGLDPGELTVQTQTVLHALRSLDQQAQAVMAFRMDGFPGPVIADALGLSEQRVRDVTKKARAKLRRTLD
jgi:RNA polymerase sigma factor (sigma-70 family)